MSYWLIKTEPDVYSYADLEADGRTWWDGVRNYQARNNLRRMKIGELVIFYHSNANPPAAVGVVRVARGPEPDATQFDQNSKYFDPRSSPESPRWTWVAFEPVGRLVHGVSLEELRNLPQLEDTALVRVGNRLSVLELGAEQYHAICQAGGGVAT